MMARVPPAFVSIVLVACLCTACSVKRTAVDVVGDAISGGSGVYASDDDPDLVREAIPFGLKTYESLLAVSPEHQRPAARGGQRLRRLRLPARAGGRSSSRRPTRPAPARCAPARASCSSAAATMRCAGSRSRIPASRAAFAADQAAALALTTKQDAAFLYWAGAGWAGALGADKHDPRLIADLPGAGALVGRVLVLDESL